MQRSANFIMLSISLIIIALGKNDGHGQVRVKIPDIKTKQDTIIDIPVLVSDLSDYGIISYQFLVKFDSLVIKAVGVSAESTLTAQWGNAIANVDSTGWMIVGAFGVSELKGGDTLINLVFEVIAQPGDSTPIILEKFKFNNENPTTLIDNGSLKVSLPTGIRDRNHSAILEKMRLLKNFPEPFHDRTTILLHLNQPGKVEMEIFNLLGQTIKQYDDLYLDPGGFSIDWNAINSRGMRVPPGVYFCVVKQDNKIIAVDRMILLK
ncbi:MAG: T9SS type A sorting domain-containing protein [bacterium]|nr:MAG: T9SS type A sorting domain-containing protein [bacterium]